MLVITKVSLFTLGDDKYTKKHSAKECFFSHLFSILTVTLYVEIICHRAFTINPTPSSFKKNTKISITVPLTSLYF